MAGGSETSFIILPCDTEVWIKKVYSALIRGETSKEVLFRADEQPETNQDAAILAPSGRRWRYINDIENNGSRTKRRGRH